jgi:D-beta-D-heptose 7-phosphate kinase/D-beta-D-heptose 1-phosphate adenosyltransferase
VYDVVGAGDTVTAYLAAILGAGGTAAEAAMIANYAAGVEVGKLGAATVNPGEVLDAFDHFGTQAELPSSHMRTAADVLKG